MAINFGDGIIVKTPAEQKFPISAQSFEIDQVKARFSDYIEKIDSIVEKAESLAVTTENTNEEAVNIGTSAKHLYKKIEDQRKEIIEQPNEFVKSVNSFCKIFTEKLQSIETMMKSKIGQYRAIQEQKRREAEIAAKKAADDLQKKLNEEAKVKGTEPVKVETPIIPKKESVTRTETGSAHGRKIWTFEIIDSNKVPREYLIVSDILIRDAVKAGIREIPGVKIFEKSVTTFRT